MDLKANLRQAISWYGLEVVYNGLHEICKEDYEFLKKLYEVPGKVKAPSPAPAQEPSPEAKESSTKEPSTKEEEIPRPEKLKDAKVRVVKKPTSPEDLANIPLTHTTSPVTNTPPVTQSVTSALVQGQHTQHTESGLTDPKDIKKWQKEQEDKKKRELDAQGINPASLLTKENLQKWIVEEKKTFAAVARDYVGLPDSMVSSAAKSYGIHSETSKRRAIIAASKRK